MQVRALPWVPWDHGVMDSIQRFERWGLDSNPGGPASYEFKMQKSTNYLFGTRILTVEEIKNMSDGSLNLYHKRAQEIHSLAHMPNHENCSCHDYMWDYVSKWSYDMCKKQPHNPNLTKDQIKNIKTADYLLKAVQREKEERAR